MKETKKIIIGMDFSDQALIAMEQSYNLSRELNAEIQLVHFSNHLTTSQEFKQAEQKLIEIASSASEKTGLVFTPVIKKGDRISGLIDFIEKSKPEFVFLGVSGKKDKDGKQVSSTAFRIIREVKYPVFTIKGKQHYNGCRNIILPLDLSKQTSEKINASVRLGQLWGCAVNVVSVITTYDDFLINKISRQLSKITEHFDKYNIESTAEIIKGIKGKQSAAEMIISYAHKAEGDLILIMTQEEDGDYDKEFLGSTAEELINTSDIPVISIVPKGNSKKTS